MDSPLYAGEQQAFTGGLPFPPLTPYADVHTPGGPEKRCSPAFSPARAMFARGSPGMQHASPAKFPKTAQQPQNDKAVSTDNLQKFRGMLRATNRKLETAAEDRQEVRSPT